MALLQDTSAKSSTSEPAHLTALNALATDETLSLDARKSHEAEYWRQYSAWHCTVTRLARAVAEIGDSEFWASVCEALSRHWACSPLPEVERIVCLCLGSLDDHASVYQLSLLLLLCEKHGMCHDRCSIFDPCHTDRDRSTLRHLGFMVLDSDAKALTQQVSCMTLFYMPHGDYNLTDDLVWTNRHALHLVAVLGNDFDWVCDPCVQVAEHDRIENTRAPYVQRVLPFIEATGLPDTLTAKTQERLATLVPQASRTIGDRLVDCLDCTLTTFPPAKAWEGIDWPTVAPLHRSLL
mmetsp:Transcript_17485/g.43775  ORF Transcript_17485/g.43775 Transcript_17485/m.43775 type:complete len:294 (+) Transcript_17485:58-939(+)